MTEVESKVTAKRSATQAERSNFQHRAAPLGTKTGDGARERASWGRERAGRWPRLLIRRVFFFLQWRELSVWQY